MLLFSVQADHLARRVSIAAFYEALGMLCRTRDGRGQGCEGCPAREFCYTAPGSVTDDMLTAIVEAMSTSFEAEATKRNSTEG